ncbi:MAG: DUF2231 domain-containing protein, partial [Pirellulaceae bacterium]
MLMVFPIALLVAVLAADLVFWGTGDRFWAHAAEWLLAIGVILGAVVADLGLIAFITVSRVRSRVAGWVYSLGTGPAILVALGNLMYRAESDTGAAVIPLGIILSAVVVALLLVTGWLAGERVFRHRIGIVDSTNVSRWSDRPRFRGFNPCTFGY